MGTRIGAIDPTWNQQGELYDRPCELALPYSSEVLAKLKTDPSIIHFSSVDKPWHYGSSHPFAQEWMDVVDDTAFAGWRPKRPSVPVRIATGVENVGPQVGRSVSAGHQWHEKTLELTATCGPRDSTARVEPTG